MTGYRVALAHGPYVKENVESCLRALGGIHSFVPRGSSVLIKPNFTASREANTGASTDLELLECIIGNVRKAGVKKVILAEGAGSIDYLTELPGIKEFLARVRVEAIDLNQMEDEELETVTIKDPLIIKELRIPRVVLEADVIINVPKLKVHPDAVVSLAMKNLMGTFCGKGHFQETNIRIPDSKDFFDDKGRRWVAAPQARIFHNLSCTHGPEGIGMAIVDLNKIVPSHLVVVDGMVGMEGEGSPSFGYPKKMDTIIAGANVVAVDMICAILMGYDPEKLEYLRYAHQQGLGPARIDEIDICGVKEWTKFCRCFSPAKQEHQKYLFKTQEED